MPWRYATWGLRKLGLCTSTSDVSAGGTDKVRTDLCPFVGGDTPSARKTCTLLLGDGVAPAAGEAGATSWRALLKTRTA